MNARRETGLSLITVLFFLVVIGALGGYMLTIFSSQQLAVVSSSQASRAYYAARAGVEWAIWGALNDTAATCGGSAGSPASAQFDVDGFDVTVTCSYRCYQEASVRLKVFAVEAHASQGSFGTAAYAARTIRAAVTDAPSHPAACS